MTRNIERLRAHLEPLGPRLNPHLKTAKSVDIARRLMQWPNGPCTVSTLAEAEYFADAGATDILYAVGIGPDKLAQVVDLLKRQVRITVVVDNVDQARAVAAAGTGISALIEIDTDGHRGGVRPEALLELCAIAGALTAGAAFRGVLTHAGASYDRPGPAALESVAEQERAGAILAAETLRVQGFDCPVVSIGSTPTVLFARDLSGVTEVRAGVFVFFDLVMVGLGVCGLDEIALSVLATVIGHQRERGHLLIDAGWNALSLDRGTARQAIDQGFGLVCGVDGRPIEDLIVAQVYQEHGVLALREGSRSRLPDLPYGSKVRIFPNHACAMAAQHDQYWVIDGLGQVVDVWPRMRGW